MQTQTLGSSNLQVTRIAYGCMPLGGEWDDSPLSETTRKEALRSIHAALDQGMNFYDHADIYCIGKSEVVFSAIWQEVPGLRSQIILQSKCGIRFAGEPNPGSPHRFDFSYAHILRSVENSLKRLKTDYLDVLLLHRPDPLVEPEEVARAFDELHQAGKVRWFGVSNHTAAQLDLLRIRASPSSPTGGLQFDPHRHAGRGHCLQPGQRDEVSATRARSSTAACTTSPCSPGARWPRAAFREERRTCPREDHPRICPGGGGGAREGVSAEAIIIAWICCHPARIRAIIGTTRPSASPRPARQTGSSWTRGMVPPVHRGQRKVCRKENTSFGEKRRNHLSICSVYAFAGTIFRGAREEGRHPTDRPSCSRLRNE
jgi:predicted oxidoreductase